MKVIAVDFDGCLCEPGLWPLIGRANRPVIEELIKLRNSGIKIILYTCREGEPLTNAVNWCKSFGLEFDAVNENIQERIVAFGGDSRKISADEYWDDRAICVQFKDTKLIDVTTEQQESPKTKEQTSETRAAE